MKQIKILIVLYNKTILDSETCVSLIDSKELLAHISEVIIWDNSNKPLSKEEVESYRSQLIDVDIAYIYKGKNVFLSEIYNNIIDFIDDNGLLLIFDHDSVVPSSYFIELFDLSMQYTDINLFLPRIYYDNNLLSPAKLFFFVGRYFTNLKNGACKTKHLTAINSGMAIRCRYLKTEFSGYNTNIRFYGTDNDFMYKYAHNNQYACVMKTEIEHKLDYYEEKNMKRKLQRFRDVKYGALMQMKDINWGIYILCSIYFFLLECKLSVKYKSFLPFRRM